MKLYEAIITQTPFIATKVLNPGRMAEEYNIGISADTRSVEDIKKAISMFTQNNMKMFKQNMKNISPRFEWNEAVKILDEIYK